MASRPNPSWSEPQKKVFNAINEARDLAIPHFGEEIPGLGNLTPNQLCDQIGVVKEARKAMDTVEKTLIARFKPQMEEKELRGSKYIATKRSAPRVALNQKAVKEDLLERADELGVDIERLLDAVADKKVKVPDNVLLDEEESNMKDFHSSTDVETLRVDPIA